MFLFAMLNDKRVNIPRSVTSPILGEYPHCAPALSFCSTLILACHASTYLGGLAGCKMIKENLPITSKNLQHPQALEPGSHA